HQPPRAFLYAHGGGAQAVGNRRVPVRTNDCGDWACLAKCGGGLDEPAYPLFEQIPDPVSPRAIRQRIGGGDGVSLRASRTGIRGKRDDTGSRAIRGDTAIRQPDEANGTEPPRSDISSGASGAGSPVCAATVEEESGICADGRLDSGAGHGGE